MADLLEAHSPYTLIDEVEHAREVLVLTYTASLEFFERFVLSDARALGALVTVFSDAAMVRADPVVVRRAGVQYLDSRVICPDGAFHPKLLVVVGDGQARIAIGSGNLTMAGWYGNAETWTVLRGDQDGGPATLREVARFLLALAASEVASSKLGNEALMRVAHELDELPADQPGPTLLHSVEEPIIAQLRPPSEAVEQLALYSPFHDAQLAGVNALLDLLAPGSWTVFVQPDTVVDGPALEELAEERGGRVAWIERRPTQEDGSRVADERYWHGKLAQWTSAAGTTWALTGSPNLSRPALLAPVGGGGNCELALLSQVAHDLTPAEGEAPAGGLALLERPGIGTEGRPGPVLISAVAAAGLITVELHRVLEVDGVFERYSTFDDRWTEAARVFAGADHYKLDAATAGVGEALRLRTADGAVSNEVFVADPSRLLRRQIRAIGKVRKSPEDVVREGLGPQLLADIDALRAHLLAVGATVRVPRPSEDAETGGDTGELRVARPAPGQTLEEYLEACDPVLGRRMTEFALVLPALPGVGASLDDEVGTLDNDTDTTVDEGDEGKGEGANGTVREELEKQTPSERSRYRSFVERLVGRAASYPLVVRNIAFRTLLHSVAAQLWPEEQWPELLSSALLALAAPGDEPREEERAAAGSLAAAGLALLRTDVPRMSVRDERQLRYVSTGAVVRGLLEHRDPQQIEMLAADLPGRLSGPAGALAAEQAAEEALNPLRGIDRAVRLLGDEHLRRAAPCGAATIVLEDPLPQAPEPLMVVALRLTNEDGPVFVRGRTDGGQAVLAAWCSPWLAVERTAKTGLCFGRAWNAGSGTLHGVDAMNDRADLYWDPGDRRPDEVRDLLLMADEDWVSDTQQLETASESS